MGRKKILFAGDGNLDLVLSGLELPPQEDKEVFCAEYVTAVGGSCTIAASAYGRLGGACDYCGLLGDDANGRAMTEFLADAGVGLSLARRDAAVRTGVTVNLVRGRTRTQVTYPGCLSVVDETETIIRKLGNYAHLHLSGLYGTKRFLPRVIEVLRAAKAAGVTVSLDTQWDSTEEWRHADSWLPLLTWLIVNEDEAVSLARRFGSKGGTGPDTAPEAAWKVLKGLTPSPIIKLGPLGALADGKLRAPVRIDRVVDTTGAGDSFAAGFLFALVELGYGFDDAMHYAQAAGALACTFEGGSSPLFTREKVDALARKSIG